MIDKTIDFDWKNLNCILISVKLKTDSIFDVNSSLDELEKLCETLGVKVLQKFIQNRNSIDPAFFIGSGKIEEIKEYIKNEKIDLIIFDNELSGIQKRNLEKIFEKTILDRTNVILHIFKKRARTSESKLQVELAENEYILPRLKNLWTHFSRTEGVRGIRGGEGEKQLELDRRIVKEKINSIKKRLSLIDRQMETRRKKRKDCFKISLVGYTNAGKSSLMNLLSKSNRLSEDLLFSTIDSTIRKVYLNENITVLLNDTVGFIRKLPHSLVASFKSTLKEIQDSNLLLHIIDISNENYKNQINEVNKVLKEIDSIDIPTIYVYNKIDKIENFDINTINKKDNEVFISTYTKTGIEELKNKIIEFYLKSTTT